MKLISRLWRDEAGFVVSAELVLVASVAVLAMIVGLAAARDGINSELADVADTWQELNQGYQINHVIGHSAAVAGSEYIDDLDYCDAGPDDSSSTLDEACIVHSDAAGASEGTQANPSNNN